MRETDALYEKEYNCKTTDLVDGFPPDGGEEAGAKMFVWDSVTKKLVFIFKKVFGAWYKI